MIVKYTTIQNQTWFDLALQLLGNPDLSYDLAKQNNSSILVNPLPFTEISFDTDALPISFDGYNNSNNNVVSTAPNIFIIINSFSNDFNLNEFF
jgi:hypothetical protein